MIYEKVSLGGDAYLEVFAADKTAEFVRDAILVIPGGGYSTVCSDREGEPIAMAFMPYGYSAFVLHYSVAPKRFPTQLQEASRAMAHIRDNAARYGINPERVFVIGFSAGGHLAASLGTMWDTDYANVCPEKPKGYNKPTGMMLMYPVTSGVKAYSHFDSLKNLLGEGFNDKDMVEFCSIENRVSRESSPAFIMHTSNDQLVNVRNSIVIGEKFAQLEIPFEMHIYYDAPHGVALANKITKGGWERQENRAIEKWVEAAVLWAEQI